VGEKGSEDETHELQDGQEVQCRQALSRFEEGLMFTAGPDWVSPDWVAQNPDNPRAQSLMRTFRSRWPRSSKRCPPGFYVDPNGKTFNSYVVDFRRDPKRGLVFGRDYFTNGHATPEGARQDAWDWYEEIWPEAHKALAEAGAFPEKETS